MKKIIFIAVLIIVSTIILVNLFHFRYTARLPTVVIANYGPHASLDAVVIGIEEQLAKEGFAQNKDLDYLFAQKKGINYLIKDIGFDPSLIPLLFTDIKKIKPKVLVVITTPVAQFAKGNIKDIPLVYSAITDPIEAGLIKRKNEPDKNMTGSSDQQDLQAFLKFTKKLLPRAKNIGILYATSESNDRSLVNAMRAAALNFHMNVVAIPVIQSRDVSTDVRAFSGKVDLIYVGSSGPIQPALPAIVVEAEKMHIPVFNVEEQAVRDGLVLASFGVNYKKVGENTGKLVAALLKGKNIKELPPIYPKSTDQHAVINKKQAEKFGISIPKDVEVVQ